VPVAAPVAGVFVPAPGGPTGVRPVGGLGPIMPPRCVPGFDAPAMLYIDEHPFSHNIAVACVDSSRCQHCYTLHTLCFVTF
jgi:hypothetical protein